MLSHVLEGIKSRARRLPPGSSVLFMRRGCRTNHDLASGRFTGPLLVAPATRLAACAAGLCGSVQEVRRSLSGAHCGRTGRFPAPSMVAPTLQVGVCGSSGWSPFTFRVPVRRRRADGSVWVIFQDQASRGCAVARSERSQRSASGRLRDAKLRMITLRWTYSPGSG